MTPEDSWFVKVDKKVDETKSCLLASEGVDLNVRKKLPVAEHRIDSACNSVSYLSDMDPGAARAENEVAAPEEVRHRRHYRVVFKEYATPMFRVPTLGDVYRILADVIEGSIVLIPISIALADCNRL